MRSFLGRHILSIKDFERHGIIRIFRMAMELELFARDRRNGDLLKQKMLVSPFTNRAQELVSVRRPRCIV